MVTVVIIQAQEQVRHQRVALEVAVLMVQQIHLGVQEIHLLQHQAREITEAVVHSPIQTIWAEAEVALVQLALMLHLLRLETEGQV